MPRFPLMLFIVSLSLGGCAVTLKMHGNRLQSPEASGGGKFGISSGFETRRDATLINDIYDYPNTLNHPTFHNYDQGMPSFLLGGHWGLPFVENLDLEVRQFLSHTGTLGLKYQFMGAAKDTAKDGNLSLAASVAGGISSNSSGTSDTSGRTWGSVRSANSTLKVRTLDLALIGGFRFTEHWLVYATGAYTRYGYDAVLDQTLMSGGTAHYTLTGVASQWTEAAGVEWTFGERWTLKGELAYSRAKVVQEGTTAHDSMEFRPAVLMGVVFN